MATGPETRNRRRQPGSGWLEGNAVWLILGVAVLLLAVVNLSAHLGQILAGDHTAPGDPWVVFFGVLSGDVDWPATSTAVAVALIAAAGVAAWWLRRRARGRRKARSRVDWTSSYLGRGQEIAPITKSAAQAKAERLGVAAPGLPLGRDVVSGAMLYSSWEDCLLDIWGPRTGKTTARAVPSILAAPGAVVVTSNKRDVVDATRDPRAEHGDVWVFDPQGIVGESPDTWWWNPLSYVVDEDKAANLSTHFADATRQLGAKTDAYFDGAGRNLLTGLLLAAALDNRPITDIRRWMSVPNDPRPVLILREHDFELIADGVESASTSPDKQRAGIYGTAEQMTACLTSRKIARWVTPQPGDTRRQFDPADFAASTQTLYSVSKEGQGSAGPLTAALAVAVTEAAEERATTLRGGRLDTPMVVVLDEAANVCRWSQLPNQYSHYGSRGIVVMTILQSWAQGVEVWGEKGMEKLWSAANVFCYGGGVSDAGFLESLAKIVGTYDKVSRSTSTTSGSSRKQRSTQLQRERILDVEDLAAWPAGRALVLASGARPTLVRTIPWYESSDAERIRASMAAHDPATPQAAAGAYGQVHRTTTGKAPQFGPATSVIKEL